MSVAREGRREEHPLERSIVSAREGNFSALGQLFEHYRDYLLRVANDEFPDDLAGKIAASDLVQETFLDAAKGFPQFHGRTEPELRAWLRRILLNELVETRRRFNTQRRLTSLEIALERLDDDGVEFVELRNADPAPSSILMSKELRVELRCALGRLPNDYRQVIELRSFEGLSFEQVGQQLDRSADAARSLWSRAIQRLAAELSP